MIEAMREVALEWLKDRLEPGSARPAGEVYREARELAPQRLSPFLVERVEGDEGADARRFYVLSADSDNDEVALLEAREMRPGDGEKRSDAENLPFNQASGPRSAALGPVIKRAAPTKDKEAGPLKSVRDITLRAFQEIGCDNKPWSPYFRAVHECWTRKKLKVAGAVTDTPDGAYSAAVGLIGEKKMCLLAFADGAGRLPGEVPEYTEYLQGVLALAKYTNGPNPAVPGGTCPMCGAEGVDLYPNVLYGAGVNLGNLDRSGAFPGLNLAEAWKGFAPCLACADLLYIYRHHAAREFMTEAAGQRALAVPSLVAAPATRAKLLGDIRTWAKRLTERDHQGAVVTSEHQMLRALAASGAVNSVSLVWAEFGQRIENVTGVVTEILPSRLRHLAHFNERFEPDHPALPSPVQADLPGFRYDLSLNVVWALLRRPGGKAAQKRNDSRRLFDLRRDVAEAIYHGTQTPQGRFCPEWPEAAQWHFPQERFWAEWLETARWHWDAAVDDKNPVFVLTQEGLVGKKNEPRPTLAGWVRQTAKFLFYCRQPAIGVLPAMNTSARTYAPGVERLRPYFGPETGIDTDAKAFAFLLGVLYGKLVTIQASRKVNVGANTLTWLRRMTLAGPDLPELFVRVLGKLTEYESASKRKRSRPIAEVEAELAGIGARLGTAINLDQTEACYFLLLGQSLSRTILPPQPKPDAAKPSAQAAN